MGPRSPAAAAKGNVNVIAEPVRQRDVPAPPKILDSLGEVGVAEVLKKIDAEMVDVVV